MAARAVQAKRPMAYAYMPEPEPPLRILLATLGRDPKQEAAIALIRDGFRRVAAQAKIAMEEWEKAIHRCFEQFPRFEEAIDVPAAPIVPAWWYGRSPGFFALARPQYGGGRGDTIRPGGVSQRKGRRGRRCSPRPWSGR